MADKPQKYPRITGLPDPPNAQPLYAPKAQEQKPVESSPPPPEGDGTGAEDAARARSDAQESTDTPVVPESFALTESAPPTTPTARVFDTPQTTPQLPENPEANPVANPGPGPGAGAGPGSIDLSEITRAVESAIARGMEELKRAIEQSKPERDERTAAGVSRETRFPGPENTPVQETPRDTMDLRPKDMRGFSPPRTMELRPRDMEGFVPPTTMERRPDATPHDEPRERQDDAILRAIEALGRRIESREAPGQAEPTRAVEGDGRATPAPTPEVTRDVEEGLQGATPDRSDEILRAIERAQQESDRKLRELNDRLRQMETSRTQEQLLGGGGREAWI